MAEMHQSGFSRTRRKSCVPAALLGIVLGAAAMLFFVRQARTGAWEQLASMVTGRSLAMNLSQPAVVNKIQRLQRLETVHYSLDKIVEGDRQSAILPDFLVGDKLLMVVHGSVIAGIDLSKLTPKDVVVSGRDVAVHLPPAEIFVATLDNAKTRVYSRTTGLLVPEDPNLESEVRAQAQQQIQQAALADGVLVTAAKNADATVASMLSGLGFQKITVN